jgi:hypothetical protein
MKTSKRRHSKADDLHRVTEELVVAAKQALALIEEEWGIDEDTKLSAFGIDVVVARLRKAIVAAEKVTPCQ